MPNARTSPRIEYAGFLSMALQAALYAIPRLPGIFAPYKIAMGLVVLCLVVYFAFLGMRAARRSGRAAAWTSLVVLGSIFAYSLAMSVSRTATEAANRESHH
ncbi:hypothetical protein [Singulisphaera sp. PoT]|uniref:hypothetical protein n=1 Tax=Singulisphaera sp. PoT TaxID=3411797 RepID=UPI003BF5FB8F